MRHAEALLFVDDDQAEVLELTSFDQPMRADEDVELARRRSSAISLCFLLGVEAADHVDRRTGTSAMRSLKVRSAARPARSSARGRRPACRPSTALNAARIATSVLP